MKHDKRQVSKVKGQSANVINCLRAFNDLETFRRHRFRSKCVK